MGAAARLGSAGAVRVEGRAVIRHLIGSTVAKLRPSGGELYRLVVMESDPAFANRFEQLTPGPALAIAGLAAIALYGVISAPLRLFRRPA
jgi:hypothetical protein